MTEAEDAYTTLVIETFDTLQTGQGMVQPLLQPSQNGQTLVADRVAIAPPTRCRTTNRELAA